jgi:hypothetical protein
VLFLYPRPLKPNVRTTRTGGRSAPPHFSQFEHMALKYKIKKQANKSANREELG